MAFESFSIRRISDNINVPLEEVDTIVRKELSLQDCERDKPYGHFYFTETEKELGGFQKSISWAGLIHTIVYYSNIGYGYRDVFEILGALYETKNGPGSQCILIRWPYSTFGFTAKLLQLLKNNGLYVYVEFDDSPECLYENLQHSSSVYIYKSKSGRFICDLDGQLIGFYPVISNIVDPSDMEGMPTFNLYHPCLHTLEIPEGVTNLSRDFFKNGYVQDTVSFPKSLKSIGTIHAPGVFSQAFLPRIDIPDSITTIGPYAFAESKIKCLYIPKMFEYNDTCQFKNAVVDKLILHKQSTRGKIFARRKNPYNYFRYNYAKICRVGSVEYA